ncbi:hypothetical protein [Kitasatospora sp. NPDC094016]|uniref:hypothetical protein n=1 Tax=Kitasatospora sp. NPDC094016 TaxID=3154986 RepID=UPI003322EBCA
MPKNTDDSDGAPSPSPFELGYGNAHMRLGNPSEIVQLSIIGTICLLGLAAITRSTIIGVYTLRA